MAIVTWNPAENSSGNVSLTGSNLTATTGYTDAFRGARANLFKSTGKFYYEATIGAMGADKYVSIGFSTATFYGTGVLFSALKLSLGYTAYSVGYLPALNTIAREADAEHVTASFSAASVGDVIGCGIDLDTGLTEFFKNGVLSTAQVAAVAAGSYAPTVGFHNLNDAVTANFGRSAFYAGLPTGYSAWEENPSANRACSSPKASPRPVHFIGL